MITQRSRYSPNADISATLTTNAGPILDRLKNLDEKMQKKEARRAARKAMQVVRKAAIANAQKIDDDQTREAIFKNIAVQYSSRQSKRVGGVVIRVGVLGGARQYANTRENVRKRRVGKTYKTLGDKGNPGGDTWYWRFLEFGTQHSRALPFLQQALAENTERVTDVTVGELKLSLDKLVSPR